ncbi:HPr kinase/phosphatase C-terminal domain-containing protein [Ancylobacter sp. A5.8]|uniref:HPr kinase/phosphorylase n=1 Tax=Ancylobacter gelatini TaxID=2919920 RepID=UPI001F4EC48D|nr:HPr kinase/phosphatase C-terminal domain-containing protein [Ancylobacter gelatini]MCJ8142654.1 HPr kinase/phosphatase C-terminal domain-containing protein [Ancylobacter gelatini]
MPSAAPSIHASCVRVGEAGVLIRGAPGAGKSRLAFALVLAGGAGMVPPVRLVADDRVLLARRGDRLFASAPQNLAGLIEVRGAGIRRLPFLPEAAVDLVVDLDAGDAARLPAASARSVELEGIDIKRLSALGSGDVLQQVLALLLTSPSDEDRVFPPAE